MNDKNNSFKELKSSPLTIIKRDFEKLFKMKDDDYNIDKLGSTTQDFDDEELEEEIEKERR